MQVVTVKNGLVRGARAALTNGKRGGQFYALYHGDRSKGCWEYFLPLKDKDFPCGRIGKVCFDPEAGYKEAGRIVGGVRVDTRKIQEHDCPVCGGRVVFSLEGSIGNQLAELGITHEEKECPHCIENVKHYEIRDDVRLRPLEKTDPVENDLFVMEKTDTPDAEVLLLWTLPNLGGKAVLHYEGEVQELARGYHGVEVPGNPRARKTRARKPHTVQIPAPVLHIKGPARLLYRRETEYRGMYLYQEIVFDPEAEKPFYIETGYPSGYASGTVSTNPRSHSAGGLAEGGETGTDSQAASPDESDTRESSLDAPSHSETQEPVSDDRHDAAEDTQEEPKTPVDDSEACEDHSEEVSVQKSDADIGA